jgi:flagellar hook-associated protein 2
MEGAMGTIGLNFGSATSGAGFNVSSTVAAIVSNLQNVETPWKTQLTTLQSQDTAISSLGTLFSNLSSDMSSLTDLTGTMSQKLGSSSDQNVLTLSAATSAAVAGTHVVTVSNLATTSSGYLVRLANGNDPLSGSITLQAGNGTALTINVNSSDNTLAGLAATINSSGAGINASVLTDSSGSLLSLVSNTSGAHGNIVVSGNTLTATDSTLLNYTGTAGSGSTASTGSLDPLANSTDTLSGSMSIQVGTGTTETIVIGAAPSSPAANTIYTGTGSGWNTLSGLTSAISSAGLPVSASIVTNGSTGQQNLSLTSLTPGSAGTLTVHSNINDLTGTTALTYSNPVTGADANLTVDGVAMTSSSNTVANLIPGVTFQLLAPSATLSGGGLEQVQVVIANNNSGVVSSVSQMVSDYNALISGVNAQEGLNSSNQAQPLFGSPTLSLLQQQLLNGLNLQSPNGTLTSVSANSNTTLSGSISIQVGSGVAKTITISSDNTLSSLAKSINQAGIGVVATVLTRDGQSTLALASQTAGAAGALIVNPSIVATSGTMLGYTDSGSSSSGIPVDIGKLTGISSQSDALAGSITIQIGNGQAQTISVPAYSNTSPSNNLAGLAGAINSASIGANASVVQNSDGSYSLQLQSETLGSAGNMTVTSNIIDTTNTVTTALHYSTASDINSLSSLGISVNNNGSLTFDAASLDSVLNTDFSGVVGFFQNSSGWGQSFSTMLTNSGTGSVTGVLSLALSSNSNIESTLNADISKEELQISVQSKSLTTELNTANQVIQSIPSMLSQVNELYSAITGYNQQTNG